MRNIDRSTLLHFFLSFLLFLSQFHFSRNVTPIHMLSHIEDEVQNAQATGGNGTPWSIVVAKNGKKYPLSGAQPYASIKQIVEQALQEK